jgi:hypothetical protein
MYLQLDVVKDAEERAEATAFKDRMRYIKFIEAGEQFAAKHGLIVCGAAATRLLLGRPEDPMAPPALGLDSFQLDLFSGQAPRHALGLGDTMYLLDPEGLGHYTTVLTKIANYLLTVVVDGRDLFIVTSLPVHRGVRMADVIIPSERPAQFAKDGDGAPLRLLCTGPEIQLMGVYAALCNPAKAASWESLLGTEASLRRLFIQEIQTKFTTAVARMGGAHNAATSRVYTLFRDKYATGPGRVVIGSAGIALLTGKSVSGEERLQVITAGRLEGDAEEVIALAKTVGIEATFRIEDPKVPTDHRLRRMTVYIIVGRRRSPILDVYNSAAFDIVPYVLIEPTARGRRRRAKDSATSKPPAALKIGTPFVLMRHCLVDIWSIQVLMRMGAIKSGTAIAILSSKLASYNVAAAYYESILAGAARDSDEASHRLMPMKSYIGRLEDSELALKRAAQFQAGARFYPPYYPASRNKNGPAADKL